MQKMGMDKKGLLIKNMQYNQNRKPKRQEEGGGIKNSTWMSKNALLTFHEAVVYSTWWIYVDVKSGQLQCSCNHKLCNKWDT